jgi:hypothetical protein
MINSENGGKKKMGHLTDRSSARAREQNKLERYHSGRQGHRHIQE